MLQNFGNFKFYNNERIIKHFKMHMNIIKMNNKQKKKNELFNNKNYFIIMKN